MKKILVLGILAVLPLSSASYGQFLGEGTGGYAGKQWYGPSGATGTGNHEPAGFGLLATNSCWQDAIVGCNSSPKWSEAPQPDPAAVSTEDPPKTAKK